MDTKFPTLPKIIDNHRIFLIHNARIFTSEPDNSCNFEAALIVDGIIKWLGNNIDARALMEIHHIPAVIDAHGRSVLPGFNDSHFHLSSTSYTTERLRLDR